MAKTINEFADEIRSELTDEESNLRKELLKAGCERKSLSFITRRHGSEARNGRLLRHLGKLISEAFQGGAFESPRFADVHETLRRLVRKKDAEDAVATELLEFLDSEEFPLYGANNADPFQRFADALTRKTKPAHGSPRKRGPYKPRTPTDAQLEALKVVGECENNFTEAGRRLHKNPSTVRQLYEAGVRNAGKLAVELIPKPKVKTMPLDGRGQADIAGEDDGLAPAVDGSKPRVRRVRR